METKNEVEVFQELKNRVDEANSKVLSITSSIETLKEEEQRILQDLKQEHGIESQEALKTEIESSLANIKQLTDEGNKVLSKIKEEDKDFENAELGV